MSESSYVDLSAILASLAGGGSTLTPVLELILSSISDGVVIADTDRRSIFFNPAARQILGMPVWSASSEPSSHNPNLYYLHDFTPIPEDELPLVRALRGEVSKEVLLFARGEHLPEGALLCASAYPTRDAAGRITGGVVVFHDVGARKRAEDDLRVANNKLGAWVAELERRATVTQIMNDMADLLQSCRTMKEFYAVVSRFAERIFEREPGAMYLVNASRSAIELVASWGQTVPPAERVLPPEACWALRRGRTHKAGVDSLFPDCDHASSTGTPGYTCIPMMGQGEALGILSVYNHLEEASYDAELGAAMVESRTRALISVAEHVGLALANLKLRDSLRTQAIRDPLTGLFNRRHMEESLDREIARAVRSGGSVAAVMVDIDHFKRYNDTFGHAAADLALRVTATTIRAGVRADDIVCRFGGEEIVLILPDASAQQAANRAEAIRSSISKQEISYRGASLGGVTASFGVAACPSHAVNAENLLRAADEALYRAKREGRNRVYIRDVSTATSDGHRSTRPEGLLQA